MEADQFLKVCLQGIGRNTGPQFTQDGLMVIDHLGGGVVRWIVLALHRLLGSRARARDIADLGVHSGHEGNKKQGGR